MVENDYIMRLTHEMVRMWLKLLFNIDEAKEEEIIFENKESGGLYQRLRLLAMDGKVNEAENLLWEYVDNQEESREQEILKAALYFYEYLNGKSNDYLENCGYSRQEIREGICRVMRQYGYGELADTWGDEW